MRRFRLVVALLVLATLVIGAAKVASDAQRGGRGTADGSSFRADESGLLGARLLFEDLGFTVESRRAPHLPPGEGHVLVRIEGGPQWRKKVPAEEQQDGAEMRAWVERGNAVLLFAQTTPVATGWPQILGTGPAAREPFIAKLNPPPVKPSRDGSAAAELLDDMFGHLRGSVPEWGTAAETIAVGEVLAELEPPVVTGDWLVAAAPEDVVILTRGEDDELETVAAERAAGRGRVVVVADPWMLTNVRLANHPENAAFFAALVERVRGAGGVDPPADAAVWFDDRAAGQAASRGVLSLFGEIGLGPALVAGFLLLLLVAWRAGPSDAPDRFVRPDVEYHPEQLALQRGDLYADCVTSDEARRIVRDEVARRIGRGDATGCDRALAMLAARDPQRAARLRAALDQLPSHPGVSPRKHPEVWCAAVADVQSALEERKT